MSKWNQKVSSRRSFYYEGKRKSDLCNALMAHELSNRYYGDQISQITDKTPKIMVTRWKHDYSQVTVIDSIMRVVRSDIGYELITDNSDYLSYQKTIKLDVEAEAIILYVYDHKTKVLTGSFEIWKEYSPMGDDDLIYVSKDTKVSEDK